MTIKDVAKMAGVSVGTVSNVINGLDTVSAKNRKAVLKVIKETRYKHSRVAASMIKKKTSNIGLIVPDISSPYYSELIKGIYDELSSNELNVFLSGSNNSLIKEKNIIEDLLSLWIDGLLIVPVDKNNRNNDHINGMDTPVVIVNREIEGLKKDLVMFDNLDGARKATDFLIKKGHTRIILLAGPKCSRSFKNRMLGYKQALEGKGLYDQRLVFSCDYSAASGYKSMKKALVETEKIDAVFASSDLIAFGAINALYEKGLRIPDDVSLLGFGDVYLSKYQNPPLTTVKRPFYKIGRKSVEVLLNRISGFKKDLPGKYIIKGGLEIRGSVKEKRR